MGAELWLQLRSPSTCLQAWGQLLHVGGTCLTVSNLLQQNFASIVIVLCSVGGGDEASAGRGVIGVHHGGDHHTTAVLKTVGKIDS